MKPDWNDLPEWANFLTQDRDREWYCWEFEPEIYAGGSMQKGGKGKSEGES